MSLGDPILRGGVVKLRSADIDTDDLGLLLKQSATVTIAASNSLYPNRADYVCDGIDHEIIVDNCEVAWNSRQGTNVVCTADPDHKVGTYSVKMAAQAGATLGLLASHDFTAKDLSDHSHISLWIKHSLGCAYGDLVLHLCKIADCGVELDTLNILALSAGVWTRVYVRLANPAADSAIISVGIELKDNDPGAFDLFIDDIKQIWNDEATIQEAVDALPAGGGKVLFLDGTYQLRGRGTKDTSGSEYGTIRITKDNVTVEGQGPNTVLNNPTADEYTFHVRGAANDDRVENVIIRNFGFIHARPEGSVWLKYADKCLIENLWSDGGWDQVSPCCTSAGFCIYINCADHNIFKNLFCKNFRIYDISFYDSHYNILSGLHGKDGTTFINLCQDGTENNHNFISDVFVENYLGYGAVISGGSSYNTLLNYTVLNCAEYGFYVSECYSNYLINCQADYGAKQGLMVSFAGKFNHIIGFKAKFNNRSGIRLYKAHYTEIAECVLDHNDIPDEDHAGLTLSQSTFNYIHDCFITDTEAIKKQKWGIHFQAGSENNKAVHNYLAGNATGALQDEGVNNRYSEQYSDLFMDVLAVSAIYIRSNENLSEAIPNTFTIDEQPDVPRTLSGHFDSHAQITAYTIVITGVDAKGATITETKTEADGWDWETSNAFATITNIIMKERTGTGVGDTMDFGITDVLGLSNIIYATGDVFKIQKNNANATAALAQVNTTYGTYDMAVIGLTAGDSFNIYYKSNLNIIS